MKPHDNRVLVVEDAANMRKLLSMMLSREGYEVQTAEDGKEALERLRSESFPVVISDLKMPQMDGLELLAQLQKDESPSEFILITAHGTIETAVEAMKNGASDYITKPFDVHELKQAVEKAFRNFEQRSHEPTVKSEVAGKYNFIGASRALKEICRILDKVADSPSTVLITGETGTGKELIARAIHENSSRREKPFIRVNCAAIPENLLESELFGHEKGAFTGAVSDKPGRFELAHKGTLFLDEIGDTPKELQVKLLRALQDQRFERVGGIKSTQVDVRLIAATNKDLDAEVAEGNFRQDLYFRLNVVPIHLPPLRERIEDLDLLVPHFLARFNKRLGRQVREVTPQAMACLRAGPWEGNIRELENVIERSVLLADGDVLDIEDLPPEIRKSRPSSLHSSPVLGDLPANASLKEVLKEHTRPIERHFIQQALEETSGNVTRAAELLGISRKSLQMKMKEYDLRKNRDDED